MPYIQGSPADREETGLCFFPYSLTSTPHGGVGASVGIGNVGASVAGASVLVGAPVGCWVGSNTGAPVGSFVGGKVGVAVGDDTIGCCVGVSTGGKEGASVGG